MATGIVYPAESSVEHDGSEAIPPTLVGGPGALSDESDDTYATEWECNRPPPSGLTGSSITGTFAAQPDAVSATPVNIRLAVANEQNATEGWIGVYALNHATGLEVAFMSVLISPGERVVVTAGFENEAEVFETLKAVGIRIVVKRLLTPGDEPPADYMLTAYKMWMDVTIPGDGFPSDDGTGSGPVPLSTGAVTRQYPRDDGRGLSSAARLYPPTKANRIVGGYR